MGSEVEPIDAPSSFGEAPELREMVESGELPPVEERLPARPYVVPHRWCQTGNYGGAITSLTEESSDDALRQYMYGRSPLRWLNDGLDIGAGVIESWEVNDDASEWVLHIREGIKWSDGEPVTTEDVLYWWEDMVLNEENPAGPHDGTRSGSGSLMQLDAPDDMTLVVSFDSPTPLFASLLCNGVNWNDWFVPKHYLQQWHPKYNDEVQGGDWFEAHDEHLDYILDPDVPTLTGWRLRENTEGRHVIFERNPYYWCVDSEGNQLPYINEWTFEVVQDAEVAKLQIQEGGADYVHGPFVPIGLPDISGMNNSQDRHNMDVLLWDSGSGTGSVFFLNYDYPDEEFRDLFREPRFRQALSLAFDRDEVQNAIYFDTGQKTTGTYSPKAVEYQGDEGSEIYQQWRDSFVEHDPERANQLLDELGLSERDDEDMRLLPSGRPLQIRIDFPADLADEHTDKNALLRDDWAEVGIRVQLNPVPPSAFGDQWENGELMAQSSWEVGDGPDHLTGPWWFVPIEPARWAPLQGRAWSLKGTPEEGQQADRDPWERTPPWLEPEPDSPVAQLWELFAEARAETDEMQRHRLVHDMIKIHIEHGPFFMGSVANYPQVTMARQGMRNVPTPENLAQSGMVNTWAHPTPAVYDPEVYFWEDPDEHS